MRRIGPLLMSTVLVAGCAGVAANNDSIRTLLEKNGQSQPKLTDYEQGKRQLQLGNAGLAVDAFQRELKAHPQSVDAMNGLAIAYDRLGRADVAQRFLDQALSIDPNSTVTLSNLAYLNLTQGNTAVAQAYGERAKIASTLPMDMMLADTIASAVNRNIEIANQIAMNEAKPRDTAEIPNLPPERAVKRLGLNEWELKIEPPKGGEPVRVNLPNVESIPAIAPTASPQIPAPAMSSLLEPAPAADVSVPAPQPQPEVVAEPAPRPQMTESVVAALIQPEIQPVPVPVEPFVAAPVDSEPPAPQVVEPTLVQQMLNALTAPMPEDVAQVAMPEIVTPEVVTTPAAPEPAPQMPATVVTTLLTEPQVEAIAQSLPAPQAIEPDPVPPPQVLVPDPVPAPQAIEPIPAPVQEVVEAAPVPLAPEPAMPPPGEIVVASLPEPQMIDAAPQILEPAPIPVPVPQAIEPAPVAALEPQIIEPAPQVIEPAPALVPPPQAAEATPQVTETVIASVLPPPSTNPIIASVPAPAPTPETTVASVPAPTAPPPQVIIPRPSSLANPGPDSAWRAYVPANTLVRVSNGTGRSRMAARFAGYFGDHGVSVRRIANAKSFNYKRTTIFYNPDQRETAYALAEALPFDVRLVEASKGHGQIELILGFDLLPLDGTLRRS